ATRLLSAEERANIAFAFQVILGTIDSTIINEPGPVPMNQAQFIDGLTRTFALVSNFDKLVGPEPSAPSA
ncbi:MAG TPA: hypothetical protein VNR18_09320, partial [Hyphomicrobiales bacterium]|nr:hypothetical protein [Hyphomicrobiales bacterium]